jgi:hypothetical protein
VFDNGSGPGPRGTRVVVGAIGPFLGAFVLWLAIRISVGATDDPTIGYVFAAAMLGLALTVAQEAGFSFCDPVLRRMIGTYLMRIQSLRSA